MIYIMMSGTERHDSVKDGMVIRGYGRPGLLMGPHVSTVVT